MDYITPINGDVADPNRSYWNRDPLNPDPELRRGAQPPAQALEHPQREILNVITEAGLTPDGADLTQLNAAILAHIAASSAVPDIASLAEFQAGVSTKFVNVATLKSALGISKYYNSTPQTITAGGLLSLTHDLPTIPKIIITTLVCQVADAGYSPGDELVIVSGLADQSTANSRGFIVRRTSTQLLVRFGGGAGAALEFLSDAGVATALIDTSWNMNFEAWG